MRLTVTAAADFRTGPREDQGAEQQGLAHEDAGDPPGAVGQPAEHGGEGEHPGHVEADGQPNHGQARPMVAQVHRSH
jgi:hypothetical protein